MKPAHIPKDWIFGKILDFSMTTDEAVQTGPFGAQLHSYDYVEKGVPLILIKNVSDGKIIEKDIPKISEQKANDLSRYRLKPGDVVISRVGSVGRAAVVQPHQEGWLISGQMLRIRLDNPEIDSRFLSYLIRTQWFLKTLELNTVGTTRKSINSDILRNLPFIKPPLQVQHRIVEILDQADALRQIRAQADAETQKLLQSVFYEMFGDPVRNEKGWEIKPLGTLIKNKKGISCGPFGSQLKLSDYIEKGILVLGIDNIGINRFIWKNPRYISLEKFSNLKAFRAYPNDIIISRAGTIGRTCVISDSIHNAIIGSNLLKVTLDQSKIIPSFFTSLISFSPSIIEQIKMSSPGAMYNFLNSNNLRLLNIIVPPLPLQMKYEHILREYELIRKRQMKSKKELEYLFEVLMTKAFTGKLN